MKGYRGAFAAFLLSLIVFGVVIVLATDSGTSTTRVATVALNATATATPGDSTAESSTDPETNPATEAIPPTLPILPTAQVVPLDTNTLREAVVAPNCVRKVNPLLAGYNQFDRDLVSLVFEGLMTTDQYGAAIPDLAAAQPVVSQDGLTYVVRVRTDVKWHDGEPFTAEDVLFTIRLAQDSSFPGTPALTTFWQTVETDLIDAQTIRFRLAQPLATFPDALRLGILPKHVLDGVPARELNGLQFNIAPIGTGPYQFDALLGDASRVSGVRLRYSTSYSERPESGGGFAIRQIVFRCVATFPEAIAAYQRGEVNSISQVPAEALEQIASLPFSPIPAYRPALGAVIYNWNRDSVAYLRDLRMRQALARAIDRNVLVSQFLKDRALPADSPVTPRSWAYIPGANCPNFNADQPDRAAADLGLVQIKPPAPPTPDPEATADSAATLDATVDPAAPTPDPASQSGGYNFTLLTSDDPAMRAMAQEITAKWNALGVNVTLVVVDSPTLKDRLNSGNFDTALVELNLEPGADPDPYSLWRQRPEDGGLNFGRLNERRLSEVMETARRATNGADRVRLYRQFQQLFCERAAALLLYNPIYYYGIDDRLSGVQLGFMSDYSDRFRTIQAWKFVETVR